MSQPPQPPYSGQPYPDQPEGQPYGQPWSGRPNPDVPSSVPPQPGFPPPPYGQQPPPPYGQPDYGQQQPPYGQPDYGQQPPPYGQPGYGQGGGYPPPPPPKKSKAVPIILISLAVLLVLCVGGGTAIFIAAKNKATDLVDAAKDAANPTATPGTPGPTDAGDPTPPASGSKITVVEPKTLGGRPKLTDQQFESLAGELQSGLAGVPDATSSVGALYGTVEKRNIVVVAAAAAPIDDPKKELDGTFAGAGFSGLKVTNITTADPGTLGGSAKCGKSSESGVDLVLCGWADSGSLGFTIFFFQSVSKAKAEFPQLRAQIEKKSS
jgi:hypothetical protein